MRFRSRAILQFAGSLSLFLGMLVLTFGCNRSQPPERKVEQQTGESVPVSLKVLNDATEVGGAASEVKFVGTRCDPLDQNVSFRVSYDVRAWDNDASLDPMFCDSTKYLESGNKSQVDVAANHKTFEVVVKLKANTRIQDTRLTVTVWKEGAGNGSTPDAHGRSKHVKVLLTSASPPPNDGGGSEGQSPRK